MAEWNNLKSMSDLESAIDHSQSQKIIIFKHSTSCPISSIAKLRIDDDWSDSDIKLYYLDLIAHRDVSNVIADRFEVVHESPQALIIYKGECIFDTSHLDITIKELEEGLLESHV